jgi:uroporphyrinogen decarboxylase
MMRQAGRYMAVYQKLAQKHPSFRERSETTDLIVEISLQPWKAFRPDGVIIFSDILTPLPAFGINFDIEDVKGPVIQSPIRSEDGLKDLHPIDFDKLRFVGESLKILRQEVKFDFNMPLPYSYHGYFSKHVSHTDYRLFRLVAMLLF